MWYNKEDWEDLEWILLIKKNLEETKKQIWQWQEHIHNIHQLIEDLTQKVSNTLESSDNQGTCNTIISELWITKNEILRILELLCWIALKNSANLDKIEEETNKAEETIELYKDKANIDSLTWIFNRWYFNRELELEYQKVDDFYLIFIDLSNFKEINDNYWHKTWDDVLIFFTSKLKLVFWENKNSFFRYGWDEFTIISKDPEKDILKKISRLEKEIKNSKFYNKTWEKEWSIVKISFDFWVEKRANSSSPEKLIQEADKKMYKNKKNKKT